MSDTALAPTAPSQLIAAQDQLRAVSRDDLITLLVEKAMLAHEAQQAAFAPAAAAAEKAKWDAFIATYTDWHRRQVASMSKTVRQLEVLARRSRAYMAERGTTQVTYEFPTPGEIKPPTQMTYGVVFPRQDRDRDQRDRNLPYNAFNAMFFGQGGDVLAISPLWVVVEGAGFRAHVTMPAVAIDTDKVRTFEAAREAHKAAAAKIEKPDEARLRRKVTAALAEHALREQNVSFDIDAILRLIA